MKDDNRNRRQLQWKKTLRKPYSKMTLACLASQFGTELGPAQHQLVSPYMLLCLQQNVSFEPATPNFKLNQLFLNVKIFQFLNYRDFFYICQMKCQTRLIMLKSVT